MEPGPGDAADADGGQPDVPHELRQGGPAPGARVRPLEPARRGLRRRPAPGRGLPLRLRRARPLGHAAQRQRRHRRLHRPRLGQHVPPVYEGEIAGPALGVDAQAFDENGRPVVGELGELVITKPMPSMPVRFWNDPGDERYRSAYFDLFPGVWRQGDWIRFTDYGSCVITGRSDATLNRAGVRFGTSEIYVVVEQFRRSPTASSCTSRTMRAARASSSCSSRSADGAQLDDDLRGDDRTRAAHRAVAAPRPGHDRRRPGDPSHADRQEARDPGQAHPPGPRRGRGRQPRRARRSVVDRRVRSLRGRPARSLRRASQPAQRRAAAATLGLQVARSGGFARFSVRRLYTGAGKMPRKYGVFARSVAILAYRKCPKSPPSVIDSPLRGWVYALYNWRSQYGSSA